MKADYAIDEITPGVIGGWAWLPHHSSATLTVELVSAVQGGFAPIWPLQVSSPAGAHSPC
jgi:hypothetical protein